MAEKLTTEDFINKAKQIHGEKYDYSLSEYINAKVKVIIVCSTHGEFMQVPNNHKKGHGCDKCARDEQSRRQILSNEEFIRKAKTAHGDKYDYSLARYVNAKTKVKIICSTHGEFHQTPDSHMKSGCLKCGLKDMADKNTKTSDDFILEATKIHGDKYDYSMVNYTGNKIKVIVICKKHGVFETTPSNHLFNKGCPSCAESGFNISKPAILYYLSINDGEAYKIGITNRDVKSRFNNSDLSKIKTIREIRYKSGLEALKYEQRIKKKFSSFKYTGINLLESGNTECFNRDILLLDTAKKKRSLSK